jgi:hypothetical protein
LLSGGLLVEKLLKHGISRPLTRFEHRRNGRCRKYVGTAASQSSNGSNLN